MSGRIGSALIATLAVLLIVGCASGSGPRGAGIPLRSDREFDRRVRRADPGKVVAAEMAFARVAQEKGQWTAFAEYATDDAVMFVPEAVNAKQWLRGRQNPPQAVRWQPHQVWSSCDGTLAVTKGAWQRPDGSSGYFTTVWQRQRDGEYKWVMDQGDTLAQPLAAPDMVGSVAADCGRGDPAVMSGQAGRVRQEGRSGDDTLYWTVSVAPDGGRDVMVKLWQGGAMKTVLHETVAAGG